MKTLRISVTIFSLLLITSAFGKILTNPADVEAVKLVIEDYAKGIDNRNVNILEKIIYPGARFVNFNKITNKITEIDNQELVESIEKGRAGGWVRDLNINSIDVNENTAVAKVEMKDAKLKQTGFLTLIKENGYWKIMNGAYTLESAN